MRNDHARILSSSGAHYVGSQKVTPESISRSPELASFILSELEFSKKKIRDLSDIIKEREVEVEEWRTLAQKREKLIPRRSEKRLSGIANLVATILMAFITSPFPYCLLGWLGVLVSFILNYSNIFNENDTD